MKRDLISLALNGLDDRFISEAMVFHPEVIQETPERIVRMRTKRIISIALAAALILALGVVAYATDLFGLRALLIKNDNLNQDGGTNSGHLSFTQPQDAPGDLNASIRQKIDNSTKAWAEWEAWRVENGIFEPESCKAPESTSSSTAVENEDGTVTLIFYSDSIGEKEIERRVVSEEDYKASEAYWEARAKGFFGYDFSYHVYTQEMADKLERIAANYGLKLRHQRTSMFQNHDEVAEFSTREEITARINEVCTNGRNLFRTEPTGYDKFYYFDEGTFAISFFTTSNLTNTGTYCYLYNSPYGTLSSGFEIFTEVEDVSAFSSRTHTTPDGTEITVLQNGSAVYAYVYLDNSFVTLQINQLNGLTDTEVDSIIDMIDFSVIG